MSKPAVIEPLFFTVAEVADLIGVNRKTVYQMASRGEIPCRRLGRRIIFGRRALVEWVNKPAVNDQRSVR